MRSSQGREPFNQKLRFEFPKFSCVKRNGIFHFTEPVTLKWRVCCETCPAEQQRDNNYLLVSSLEEVNLPVGTCMTVYNVFSTN